jgi:gamma-glutamyltranspeptidase/glutathione hydrolase
MVKGILKISQIKKIHILNYPLIAFFLILLFFYSAITKAESYAVATRHHLATDIGMKVLEEGGNAVDAAVAVAFALSCGKSISRQSWRRWIHAITLSRNK